MRTIKLIVVFFIFLSPVASVAEDSPENLDRTATAINDRVMSPYCPGVTLSACPSPNAKSLRLNIREWLSSGMSVEKVEAKLIEDFGPGVLGAPLMEGFGIIGWLAPFAVFLLGGILILWFVRRSKTGEVEASLEPAPEASASKDEIRERLEKEIADRMVGK